MTPGFMYMSIQVQPVARSQTNLLLIGYINVDVLGDGGYLSTVTVAVDSGTTYYLFEENYWSPGPSIFTAVAIRSSTSE